MQRGEGVRRSLGPLQTALLASTQPLLDAASSLLSLFPAAVPQALCEAVGAFGEELSAHAILLLRAASAVQGEEVRSSQLGITFSLSASTARPVFGCLTIGAELVAAAEDGCGRSCAGITHHACVCYGGVLPSLSACLAGPCGGCYLTLLIYSVEFFFSRVFKP